MKKREAIVIPAVLVAFTDWNADPPTRQAYAYLVFDLDMMEKNIIAWKKNGTVPRNGVAVNLTFEEQEMHYGRYKDTIG